MTVENQFLNNGNQYVAAIAANLIFVSHGCMIGWLSPATPTLLSDDTPLKTGPLTNEQLSWIGSINPISAIMSTFTFGFITLFLGCKRTILFLTVPSVIFFVLVFVGDTYYHILIARLFTGWSGGGVQTTLIIYIAEIANNKHKSNELCLDVNLMTGYVVCGCKNSMPFSVYLVIGQMTQRIMRGRLGSFSHLFRNIGVLMAFILGAVLPYKIVPCIFVTIPIIFALWFYFLPNTPQFYLQKGDLIKAEKSLKFYKGVKDDTAADYELFKCEFERLKSLANEQKIEEKVQWSDIFSGSSLKGMSIGVILACLAYLTGYLVFTTYAVVIFEKAGATNIDPYVSSISLAVLQLIGNLCTASLCDSLGRKALLIISLLGSAFGMYVFALYIYIMETGYDVLSYEWVPVVSLSFVIFVSSAGVVPLMFLSMVENIPFKIRTIGLTVCNVLMNIVNFSILKLFPILMASIGLHACLCILGTFCLIGTFYIIFVIKETKRVALDEKK